MSADARSWRSTSRSWASIRWLAALANRLAHTPRPIVRTRHIAQAVRSHRANRWLYRRATGLVVTVSEAIRRQYLAAGLLPPDRVVTLAGGADVEGPRRIVEVAVTTLATDRALLLLGVPGTAKTWVSEHLAAAVSGALLLPATGAFAASKTERAILGGLLGGPSVGFLVGLTGGLHRYTLGGMTDVACAISTVSEGLVGGIVHSIAMRRGRIELLFNPLFVGGVALVAEVLQMAIILAVARPYNEALQLVEHIALPMMIANTVGAAMFMQILLDRRAMFEKYTSAFSSKALKIAERTEGILRQGFDQRRHLDAGLDGVIAGDQADVAAAHDQHAFGRLDQVAVDEGLEGPGAVDPRQGVAGEREHALARAGGDHQGARPDEDVAPTAHDADDPVRVHRDRGGVEPDLDRRQPAARHLRAGRPRRDDLAAPGAGAGRRAVGPTPGVIPAADGPASAPTARSWSRRSPARSRGAGCCSSTTRARGTGRRAPR